jgi:predicted DNA-binding WGR domain protein
MNAACHAEATCEGGIVLHRIDPLKNMRRFYRRDAQPDLFGQWYFIRNGGA